MNSDRFARYGRGVVAFSGFCFFAFLVTASSLAGQKLYGASDTEIKIGNIMTYTGFGHAYGSVGRAEAAYFRMINDRGGINGRKINFISLDSGSGSTNSLSLARQLVEDDGVLLIFSPIGTQTNLAIRSYMNEKQVPQLFVESSSVAFNDPSHYPWTMGFFATYRTEAATYARYIIQTVANPKIAVLYADDDVGREYLAGVHDGLAEKASAIIVKELAYPISNPEIEPKITELKASGANVFLNMSVGPFATQAIRAAYDSGWRPLQFIPNASLSVAAFLEPAGVDKAIGVISNARSKGWWQPGADHDPAVREFLDWMKKYNSDANLRDQNNVAGYERAQALVEVLRKRGDNLTRANVMKHAADLDLELGMLRPGIRIKTSPEDYQPIKQLFLIRFDGRDWAAIPEAAVVSRP